MKIIVCAITEKGKAALQTHYKEYLRIPSVRRKMLDQLFRQQILSEQPYTYEIESVIKSLNGLLDTEYFIDKTIKPIMRENGAEINTDYTLEVFK